MSAKDTPARREALKEATFEQLTNKRPNRSVVEILLDPELAKALEDAQAALSLARSTLSVHGAGDGGVNQNRADLALLAVEAAREAASDSTVTMTFESFGRLAYDDLISHHPPTDEQKAKGYGWNADTFPNALISASSVAPKLSVDEVNQLLASPGWNNADAMLLFNTALEVNNTRRTADLGKG